MNGFETFKSFFDVTSRNIVMQIIASIAIILIGIIVARILSKLTKRLLHELEVNRILNEQAGFKLPVEEFLGAMVTYIVYLIALIMALEQLGLQTFILNIILIIILVILIAFVIMAFKDFIPNIAAGFFLHQKEIIKPGNLIRIKETEGTVISISLVETQIKNKKGDIVFIPNSVLTKNGITKIKVKKKSKK